MNMKNQEYRWLIVTLCQTILLSGCTSALWEKERFARYHWPANPPNLQLFYSEPAKDLLAEYDEAAQGTAALKRRAFWLESNAPAIAAGRQPRFVSPTNTLGLAPVPVTDNPTNTPLSGYQGLYAVVSTNGQSFFLRSGRQQLGCYGLPLYFTSSGQRVKQVFLTPFAVVADATVISGCVALVGGYLYAACASQSYADGSQDGRR
jgi:hypothetical protein